MCVMTSIRSVLLVQIGSNSDLKNWNHSNGTLNVVSAQVNNKKNWNEVLIFYLKPKLCFLDNPRPSITHSLSVRLWEGVGCDAWLKLRHS